MEVTLVSDICYYAVVGYYHELDNSRLSAIIMSSLRTYGFMSSREHWTPRTQKGGSLVILARRPPACCDEIE